MLYRYMQDMNEIKAAQKLSSVQTEYNRDKHQGRLKIFFGYAAGVGTTYAMLDDAKVQLKNGVDVIVGYIEEHTKPETLELMKGLPMLPSKVIEAVASESSTSDGQIISQEEFDLDAALERRPKLILVDELSHTNANGVRNRRRYQDIEELLNAGIDVYTTVNVQHIESLNDIVQDITHIEEKETVPDYIFDHADNVKLIDSEPEELFRRFDIHKYNTDHKEPKILKEPQVLRETSILREENNNTAYTRENLLLLREVAMRKAADRISHNNQNEQMQNEKAPNIKLLVCFSTSPSSARCIRWTARTAEAFHAPWVAVYVETSDMDKLTEEEKKSFQSNVELAEQLGAEIVTLNGYDIAFTVAQYAKLSGITNIVIGKSRKRKSLKGLFELDLEDKLIAMLSNTEIHIIPDSSLTKKYRKKHSRSFIPKEFTFSWLDMGKVLGILLIVTLVLIGLKSNSFESQNIIMFYILSVLIISRITNGYIYGIIASLLSVLTYNFFFTEPYYKFNIIQHDYAISLVVFLLAALITSTLTVRIKTQANFAVNREQRTEVLYEINKKLLISRGLENIVSLTNEYVTKIFGRSVIFYTKDPITGTPGTFMQAEQDADAAFLLSNEESAVAHWVFVNQKRAGAGTDTLMGAKAYYIPVITQGNVLGVLGISCAKGVLLDQGNRAFLRRISYLMAMALERQRLSDEQRAILVESEKEKMRSNLLRAISHDLRTPLTGILGASSAILENNEMIDKETRIKLISNIRDDSQWLIRMVENLLSVTRINEDTANVTKTPEAAEEIVAAAIGRIRKRFKEKRINVSVPEELLMVPMDGTLIEQVIINLIENAIKHSGDETVIDITLKQVDDMAVFEVSDNGEGISEQDFPYLFESYVPNGKKTSDSSRGMGIGLSICMSIIKAHHGKMEASNRKEGGAIFRFELPLL